MRADKDTNYLLVLWYREGKFQIIKCFCQKKKVECALR